MNLVAPQVDLGGCAELGDLTAIALSATCPAITNLSMCGCRALGARGARALGERLSELRVLDVASCPRVTDEGLLALAAAAVRRDDRRDTRRDIRRDIPPRSPPRSPSQPHTQGSLTDLSVASCEALTDSGIAEAAEHFGGLTRLNLYAEISAEINSRDRHRGRPRAHNSPRGRSGTAAGDPAVAVAAQSCPKLRSLNVTRCEAVGDDGLIVAAVRRVETTHLLVNLLARGGRS